MKRSRGFTLIELMIAVAIIAVLAAIALPSYQKNIIKGKRAAAQAVMMDMVNRQQQYFLNNRSYAPDIATLGYALPGDVSANYTPGIALDAGPPPSFTITFTAISTGSQLSDGDLSLTSAGVKTPADKW